MIAPVCTLVLMFIAMVTSQEDCVPGYKYPVLEDCAAYRVCRIDESGITWQRLECPAPSVFCEDLQDCSSETLCPCGGTAVPITTTTIETTTPQPDCVPEGDPNEIFIEYSQASFANNWYTFVWEPKLTWEEAAHACSLNCSVLTSIQSVEEMQFLQELIGSQISGWIGGTDVNRAGFEWIENNEPIADFVWEDGEPNNAGGNEHCVELYPGSSAIVGANDKDCSNYRTFICKLL